MKKALIICAVGMSSSLMAKKTTEYLQANGHEIMVDAGPASEGEKQIQTSDFDVFLISPQTKMFLEQFENAGKTVGKPVVAVPFQAYVPIPTGIEKLASIITENC